MTTTTTTQPAIETQHGTVTLSELGWTYTITYKPEFAWPDNAVNPPAVLTHGHVAPRTDKPAIDFYDKIRLTNGKTVPVRVLIEGKPGLAELVALGEQLVAEAAAATPEAVRRAAAASAHRRSGR